MLRAFSPKRAYLQDWSMARYETLPSSIQGNVSERVSLPVDRWRQLPESKDFEPRAPECRLAFRREWHYRGFPLEGTMRRHPKARCWVSESNVSFRNNQLVSPHHPMRRWFPKTHCADEHNILPPQAISRSAWCPTRVFAVSCRQWVENCWFSASSSRCGGGCFIAKNLGEIVFDFGG